MQNKMPPPTSLPLYFALALSYLFSGLLLSHLSQQSQVVAIWAPAGIALVGCCLWSWRFYPAVFLASAAFNYLSQNDPQLWQLFSTLGFEVSLIACGATLQAAVGSMIIRHYLGNPLYLESDTQAVIFVFGVGIVTNLISANIGVFALSQFNPNYSADNHWNNVFYWWLGDSLGALIITPLLFSLMEYHQQHRDHLLAAESRPPRLLVLSTALLLFVSVTMTTGFFSQYSYENAAELVKREIKVVENSLHRQLNNSQNQISILANFIQFNPQVSRTQFRDFATQLMQDQPTIKALSWDPLINQQQQDEFNATLTQIYQTPKMITGKSINDEDPMVVVKLITPEFGNEAAIGFNLYSNAQRKAILEKAHSLLLPAATPIVQLVQSQKAEAGFLLFMPVYRVISRPQDAPPNRELLGFAAGVFLVKQILAQAIDTERSKIFLYELFEAQNNSVFASSTGKQTVSLASNKNVQSLSFELAGQTWHMNLIADPEFLTHYQNRLSIMIYILQLILVAFIILLILLMNNRQIVLNLKVADRTRALATAKQQSDEAYKAKSRFLANMSHEIRTPLNAVLGFTQLIKQTKDPQKIRLFIDKIEISSSNLLNIVNDILDISKIESKKLILERELFDLHVLLQRLEVMFEQTDPNSQVQWHVEDKLPKGVFYLGDHTRIEQILINLLSNAFKFTKQGYVTLKANSFDAEDGMATIQFSVHDSGIGISNESLMKLFDAFSQADSSTSRRFGGTGLGLTIAKELCHIMQGDITVNSKLDQGAIFTATVKLPVSQQIPTQQDGLAIIQYPQLKVLVAEDNQINQLVIVELLNALKISPIVVENGEEALKAVQKDQFDLLLMDCQMPVMDGYEATRQIRQLASCKHLPIVALTADVMPEDKMLAIEVGFSDHLGKPIELQQLSQCIAKHVGRAS